jgi:hypothetical protein
MRQAAGQHEGRGALNLRSLRLLHLTTCQIAGWYGVGDHRDGRSAHDLQARVGTAPVAALADGATSAFGKSGPISGNDEVGF